MESFFKAIRILCIASAVLILGSGVFVSAPPTACAQDKNNEISGCASDTWASMVSQATLESRRENMMNQTFIAKPDSILQYICFDGAMADLGNKAGPIFNETDFWNGKDVVIGTNAQHYSKPNEKTTVKVNRGNMALDFALAETVRYAAKNYLNNNYKHKMLGGQSSIDATPSAINCDMMKKVWDFARCQNFDGDKVFYTFDELVGNDPRKFPEDMKCENSPITQEDIKLAKNKGFTAVKFDKLKPHIDFLMSESGCDITLQTGVTVNRIEAGGKIGKIVEYPDGVCTNVGCSYKKNGGCKP